MSDVFDKQTGMISLRMFHEVFNEAEEGYRSNPSEPKRTKFEKNSQRDEEVRAYAEEVVANRFVKMSRRKDKRMLSQFVIKGEFVKDIIYFIDGYDAARSGPEYRNIIGRKMFGEHYQNHGQSEKSSKRLTYVKKRIPITISEELATEIQEFSARNGLSVSECIRRCYFYSAGHDDFIEKSSQRERDYKSTIGNGPHNPKTPGH